MTQKQRITEAMNRLEETISRQQRYILQHGDANDANTDIQWEQYKADAAYNLQKWDAMKAQRDAI